MTAEAPLFTLVPDSWYALTMYPGYGDQPYRSPVQVHDVRTLSGRRLELRYWDVGYAAGVQDFSRVFRTLQRSKGSIVMHEVPNASRITIFEPLTAAWTVAFTPEFGDMMLNALQRGDVLGREKLDP